MKTLNICVTEEDIRNGQICDGAFCPVALAIKRKFKKENIKLEDSIDVTSYLVRYSDGNGPVKRISLPMEVSAFIDEFDSEEKVNPFEFIIYIDE